MQTIHTPGIEAMSWNIQEAASDPVRQQCVVDLVRRQGPDIAALHSSHWTGEENSPALRDTKLALADLGYEVTQGDDEDTSGRADKTGWLILVRAGLGSNYQTLDLGTRKGCSVTVTNPLSQTAIRFGTAHLTDITDRYETERLRQVARLPQDIEGLLADVNSTYRSRLARIALLPAFLVPDDPYHDYRNARGVIERSRALVHAAQSFWRMTGGRTLFALHQMGFQSADPDRRPTYRIGPFELGQLDHILTRSGIDVSGFSRERVEGIDHFSIAAELSKQAV